MTFTTYGGLAVLFVALFFWRRSKTAGSSLPLPPGPKPWPLLGNITDLKAKEFWLAAAEWAKVFGDVVYLHIFGQGIVFLNSPEAVAELMERRGAIYSDKPALVMVSELCGAEHMVAFTRYGDEARRQRRLMSRALGVNNIKQYHPLIQTETLQFLRRTLADPDYVSNVKRYAGGMTLLVVYGLEVRSNNDKYLVKSEYATDLLANEICSGGGLWPVDIIPALKHMPDWFPGAGFKRKAAMWKQVIEESVDMPYNALKDNIRAGTAVPSFCSTLLEEDGKLATELEEFDIKWTANSMYASSIDTTLTVVTHFLLAMIQHPESMRKAQKELDSVVGTSRLPTFEDRPNLPFIEAIWAECLRWGCPVPLGLPHRLMEDDVFDGMFIPKGTLVFGNVWKMLRDPKLYPDPEKFYPERFLEKVDDVTARRRDPRNYAFGFGRRRCPGVHLIESSVWLLLATMLSTLDISKAVDERGQTIEPEVVFDNSVFRIPNTLKLSITPRSEQARNLVLHEA